MTLSEGVVPQNQSLLNLQIRHSPGSSLPLFFSIINMLERSFLGLILCERRQILVIVRSKDIRIDEATDVKN